MVSERESGAFAKRLAHPTQSPRPLSVGLSWGCQRNFGMSAAEPAIHTLHTAEGVQLIGLSRLICRKNDGNKRLWTLLTTTQARHGDEINIHKSIFSGAESQTAEETSGNGVTLIIFSGLSRVILGLLK